MTGAVLSKSTEPYNTYAGVPAKNVTDKLNFWKDLDLDEKFTLLKQFVSEFIEVNPDYGEKILTLDLTEDSSKTLLVDLLSNKKDCLVFVKEIADWEIVKSGSVSIFDLNTKKYVKQGSDIERDWMKFSIGYRARFIPYNE